MIENTEIDTDVNTENYIIDNIINKNSMMLTTLNIWHLRGYIGIKDIC